MLKKIRQTILFLGDIALAFVALYLTILLRYWGSFSRPSFSQHIAPFAILYGTWLCLFYIFGLYDLNILRPKIELLAKVGQTFLVCFLVGLAFFYLIPIFGITPKTNLVVVIIIFGLLALGWRRLFFALFSSVYIQKIAILGDSRLAKALAIQIKEHPQLGYKLAGFLSPKKPIANQLKKAGVKVLVIAQDITANQQLVLELYKLLPLQIIYFNLDKAYEMLFQKVPIDFVNPEWFLKNIAQNEKTVYEKIKRGIDIVLSLLIIGCTSPIWALTALCIKLEDKGPVFYRQERVGRNNKLFKIWKFRSMVENAEKQGVQWADNKDKRRTGVGKVIRRLHIDEFPQMLNVLKGELALTGPRPERPEFVRQLEKEIPHYQLRHLIKPGFTGWAQTRWIKYARTKDDSHEKFQFDLYYIKNRTLILDLSILLKTFQLFFTRG